MLQGEPIHVFNNGDHKRDYTYIDDIVDGVLKVLDQPPADASAARLYNIGNNRPEELLHFINVIEKATGKKAEMIMEPMQSGDVHTTYADITAINREFGFEPKTTLEEGVPRFVDWYRGYNG